MEKSPNRYVHRPLISPSLHCTSMICEDEAERSLHDALCVLTQTVKETRVVCGGGCMEMLMATAIDQQIPLTSGKAALAMEAFSRGILALLYRYPAV